jgi:hypothetical protein
VGLEFRVTNAGDAPDTYRVRASDSRGWAILGMPDAVALAPSTSSVYELPVIVGGAGGERDTVTFEVASLADTGVVAADDGVIESTGTTDVTAPGVVRPGLTALGPNPFRDALALRFGLARRERASVSVHDVAGRLVRVLADRELAAGEHALAWDGRDSRGSAAPAGLYWVRLRTPSLADARAAVRLE